MTSVFEQRLAGPRRTLGNGASTFGRVDPRGRRRLALGLLCGLALLGLVVLARRLGGRLAVPLDAAHLAAAGLACALLVGWGRREAQRAEPGGAAALGHRDGPAALWAAWLGPSLVSALWGAALGPGAGWLGSACLLVPLAGEAAWGLWRLVPSPTEPDSTPCSVPGGTMEGEVSQTWRRRRLPEGRERIEGALAVEIPSASRVGVAHLAFCPPFRRVPKLELEFVEPEGGVARADLLAAHGARIEVRLDRSAPRTLVARVGFVVEGEGWL